MKPIFKKLARRQRRKARVRKSVTGTPARPRLTVFRSQNNIYAQVIDDIAGRTLAAASTMDKTFRTTPTPGGNKAAAAVVGTVVAQRAVEAGVKQVVFDRNGYPYHGRVKELAEAARKAGLQF